MSVDIDSPEGQIIRKMVPFSTMPTNVFKVICDKIVLETLRSGGFLFKRGDTDNDLVYLLKGEVSLEADKLKMEVIKAGSESARFALAHQLPRKINAVAKGSVRFFRLNTIFISTPPTEGEKDSQSVSKEIIRNNGQIWLSTLLMIPIIRALPPANLHKINAELEEVRYAQGEVVINQDDIGDYYYLIKSGECLISRKNSAQAPESKIAKLQTWDTFGEAALISDEPRSETVTALTSLSLLRVSKENFLTLIKEPSLKFIDHDEMEFLLDDGAILLDVRPPDEYEKLHLEGAVNAPLYTLRVYLKTLDKEKQIIVVCNDEKISESAAFLLLTYNFIVKILKGGMSSAPSEVLTKAEKATANTSVHEDVVFDKAKPLKNSPLSNQIFEPPIFETPVFEPPVLEAPVFAISESPDMLALENEQLKSKVKELKQRCEQLDRENHQWSEKYQLLFKQTERLKAILDSLKK
jgi:CRP-like cAMP-binding protein/FtsZ-binding cell division protein ZapB